MSNPFATFRKNQSAWMAGLVLLALFAFVIAPAIQTMTGSGNGPTGSGEVVVRWDGGKVTAGDVDAMTQRNGSVRRFLTKLAETVVESGGAPKVPGFSMNPQTGDIQSLGINPSSDPRQVCQDLFMLDYAEGLGITVDQQSVDEFIKLFCDKRITDDQLLEILQETTNGRLSAFELRDTIRKQLVNTVASQVAMAGIYAQPPGKTYRDFKKINQTTKVEAFPVVVSDFVSQVNGEPTDAEVQAIYDAGSLRAPDPSSPEPGFVRLYNANFEFVTADINAWKDREKAKLTDEEVKAEYDRRVELGQMMTPVEEPASPAADTPATETPAAEATDGATEATEDAAAPAAETPAESEPAGDTTPPAETEPETPALELPESGSGDQSSTTSNVRFVSYQEEATDEPSENEADASPQATPAAETEAPAQSPADDLPPTVVQPPQLGESATDADTGDAAAPAQPQMRVKTFEEAREEIADSLAQQNAAPAMQAAIETLMSEHMQPYFQEYRQYVAFRDADDLAEDDRKVEAPKKPDLKALAEAAGLTYEQTTMVDAPTLIQAPFGQSMLTQAGASGATVAQSAMSKQVALYRPMQSTYFDQAGFAQGRFDVRQYLFWKTEEKLAYVPELDEIRDEVVEAWKVQQARRLAADAAAAIAKKVGSGDNAWSSAIEATEQALLVQAPPFSWYTASAEGLRPTAVRELDMPGNAFMQSVFNAEENSAVVAPNQPQTIYYVTRILEFGPDESDLLDRFQADPRKAGASAIANSEVQQVMVDWYNNLEQELDVQWLMPL
ncbi:MAG: hypothetical protein Aurels2KO_00940 [Aureliella sp.]